MSPKCDHSCFRFEKLLGLSWGEFTLDDDDLAAAANGQSDVSYGEFRQFNAKHETDEWFIVDVCSGSDYSGDLVNKSNFRSLLRACEEALKDADTCQEPWFVELSGGYSTFAIVLHCERTPEEIYEIIKKLDGYPVVDEDDLSELETEEEDAAWEDWVKRDFKRALDENFPEYNWDGVSDGDLYEYFRHLMDVANEYWETDGMSRHVRIDRLMEASKDDDLLPEGAEPDGYRMEDDLEGLSRKPASGKMVLPAWVRPPSRKRTR